MSQAQWQAQVGDLERFEYEQERLAEQARRLDEANAALQDAADEQFRQEIEAKYPILKGWK